MSQLEYYVRQPGDSDARGPFTHAQLADLAKAGGLNENTLYFDANADQWHPACESPELAPLLPRKKNTHVATPQIAAKLVCALLAASSLALALPALPTANATGIRALLGHPAIWIAALDLALAVCCGVFGAKVFRVIRIRAGLGIGFLGVLFWMQAAIGALGASVVYCACLWLGTVLAAPRALAANAIAGLAALATLAFMLLS